jgi:Sec-independent protein secretion pathway component TatC
MVEPKMGYDEGSFPEHPVMSGSLKQSYVTTQDFKERQDKAMEEFHEHLQRARARLEESDDRGISLTLSVEQHLRATVSDLRRRLRVAVIGGIVVSVSLSTGILAIYDLIGN